LARQWWGGAVGIDADEGALLAASLAEYAQSRTLELLSNRRHQITAYSVYESRYFGGFIPWMHRDVRLRRETSGLGRAVYRSAPQIEASATPARRLRPTSLPSLTAKGALAFATLERYIGWPALQRALAAGARRFSARTTTRADFFRTVSDAVGQDLTWFLHEAFERSEGFDYAVNQFSSARAPAAECAVDPCYLTTVGVQRNGEALFTGTGQLPVGAYESGRGLAIRVTFSDGQQVTERWDGRARSKTVVYQSHVPAVSAEIDPDRALLLDLNYRNNSRTFTPASGRAALKWSVKWLIWIQDRLLTYAFLI
jgi:hypothetical protein